jgi:DNA-binding CsgD family transcriptional regulator
VPGGGGSRSGAHFWSTLLVKLMLHFVSFLMLASVVFAAVCSALAFMLRRQLQHKAIIWFSAVTAALGCFLLEILVYRYAHALKAALTTAEYDGIMTFSELWALCGGILMTAAMPRLARLMAGYPYHLGWKIADFGLPTAAFFAGVALLGSIGGSIPIIVLQCLLFGSTGGALVALALAGRGAAGSGRSSAERRLLQRLGVWSILLLPLIVLDAVGVLLPTALNDLPITLFVPGICLIGMMEAPRLFADSAYWQDEAPSARFIKRFGITTREAELVALVIQGVTNEGIAGKLFISGKTVENHLTNIFRKTGVENRIQLFRLIHSTGA